MSHGCRKPFQGQSKGVGGSSLLKPGFWTSSALCSLEEHGLKRLRPREGSYSLKTQQKANVELLFRVEMLCLGPVTCSRQGYIKHSSCSLHSGPGGQRVGTAHGQDSQGRCKGILEGISKGAKADLELNNCLSLALLLFNV